jgi:hypothetical protein
MRPYAADTEVPVSRSKAAIEELLRQHGATEFASGWDPTHDRMQFRLFDRTIRFVLPRPDPQARKFTHDRRGFRRVPNSVTRSLEQADRQRWRALYLVIRAKLEAVEAGIAVFEQEFLAFVVMADGMTIGDVLVPRIQSGEQHLLLGDGRVA